MIKALTEAGLGQLNARDQNTYTIEVFGIQESYKLIKTIEFTSDRKMMSVVMENLDSHNFYVFSKGADISVLSCLTAISPTD